MNSTMDTVFDVTTTHTSAVGDHTRAQRAAITGAKTVNLKEKIIKKILTPVISMQNGITSFNPEELHTNDSNFFYFVGIWREQMQTLHQHFRLCYMHYVFTVVQIVQRQVRNGTGVLQFQVDAMGNPIHDASGNQIPLMENYVQEIVSIFDIWHNLDTLKVLSSCQIYFSMFQRCRLSELVMVVRVADEEH